VLLFRRWTLLRPTAAAFRSAVASPRPPLSGMDDVTHLEAKHLMRIGIALFVAISLLFSLRVSVLRGFDHEIGPDAWGRFKFAIGAAITDRVYDVSGYVIDTQIETLIEQNGLTGNPKYLEALGTSFPNNLRDPTLLNNAMERAANYDHKVISVRGASGDDLGMVDFIKLSYLLFGYNVTGFLLTYFFIFTVEVCGFLAEFKSRMSSLCVVAVLTAVNVAFLTSCLFDFNPQAGDRAGLGSVTDPRTLSILAFLPALHIGLLVLRPVRLTFRSIALIAVQAVCAGFAISIRSSGAWTVLGLLALSLVVVTGLILHRNAQRRDYAMRLWPLGLFLIVLCGYGASIVGNLNPDYRRDVTHHLFWHSVLYSLQAFNPSWNDRFGALAPGAGGDEMPWVAAENYRRLHPPAAPDPEFYIDGHLTVAGLERYARLVVFEIVEADPLLAMKIFLYYKPKALISQLSILLSSLDRITFVPGFVFLLATLAFGLMVSTSEIELRTLLITNLALTGAFVASIVPNILTIAPMQVLGDSFFVLMTAIGCWWIWGIAMLASRVRRVRTFAGGVLASGIPKQ
jgi:hypothetical protein